MPSVTSLPSHTQGTRGLSSIDATDLELETPIMTPLLLIFNCNVYSNQWQKRSHPIIVAITQPVFFARIE